MYHTYEEAVLALNSLQYNATSADRVKQRKHENREVQMTQTVQMAEDVGVTLDMIDKLSVIHVSGTKGKGSTCAYCESILRHHGYKTGFFSSPHLLEVRERIRLNGKPLSPDAFSTYFWHCYHQLEKTKAEYGGDMPTYFRFLTIMAYYVFSKEKVDVAVIEVGIGGQYDYTNIVRSPVVCGIASLGLDHVKVLGSTVEQIAWHKAGIFKPGVPAVTVPQPDGCLPVLKERASEIGNPLYLSPSYPSYDWGDLKPCKLGIDGEMQQVNASLALQLCHIWLQDHSLDKNERLGLYATYGTGREPHIEDAKTFKVTAQSKTGLETCKWPGRNQKVVRSGVTFYIDGAHTVGSVQQCVHWFIPEAKNEAKEKGSVARVLMFNLNVAGNRDAEPMLKILVNCDFAFAIFCPNVATLSQGAERTDQRNYMAPLNLQLAACKKNRNIWINLTSKQVDATEVPKMTDTSKQVSTDIQTNIDIPSEDTISNTESNKVTLTEEKGHSTLKSVHVEENLCKKSGVANEVLHFPDSNVVSVKGNLQDFENKSNPGEEYCEDEHNLLFTTIDEAVQWISQAKKDPEIDKWEGPDLGPMPRVLKEVDHLQILCVGSLHLVGGLFKILKLDVDGL